MLKKADEYKGFPGYKFFFEKIKINAVKHK